MARNKVQFQKGLSEAQFDELYGTEERCHAELARLRWPHGFECPDCGGHGHCVVKRGARQLFQCNACRKQTSMKAGTIFASSKLPLRLWFRAMYLLIQSKKGISSIELGRRLGVTQTTAWTMKHKLAQVMLELIKGISVTQIKNESTRKVIGLSIDVLNIGLRPHLTRWQARFRHWYERELKRHEGEAVGDVLDPQALQKQFPNYEELKADMERVNRQLIAYRQKMNEIIFSV